MNTTTSHFRFKLNKLATVLMFAGCMFWLSEANATTYIATGKGAFTDVGVWKTLMPGNIIAEEDSLIIKGDIHLPIDIIINGVLITYHRARLIGNVNLVVLESGSFINEGLTVVNSITNKGMLLNEGVIETSTDFINTGIIENHASIIAGNIMDNTGNISGQGGKLLASKSFVNSSDGTIIGLTDVCSQEFMNVDGGRIDSVNVSYCGQRIFNSLYLSARLKKGGIEINVLNSENLKFKNYQVLRSEDGETFEDVANIPETDITDFTVSFRYKDTNTVGSKELYYKVVLTEQNGNLKELPVVKVAYL